MIQSRKNYVFHNNVFRPVIVYFRIIYWILVITKKINLKICKNKEFQKKKKF